MYHFFANSYIPVSWRFEIGGIFIISVCYCYSISLKLPVFGGSMWRTLLRHCATSQKVAGSIPNGVSECCHGHIPSIHTVALGLTQPQTEMSTRNISQGSQAAGA